MGGSGDVEPASPESIESVLLDTERSGGPDLPTALTVNLRSEVNNSLIIVNFFHKIQNFRQISDLFSQI